MYPEISAQQQRRDDALVDFQQRRVTRRLDELEVRIDVCFYLSSRPVLDGGSSRPIADRDGVYVRSRGR